MKKKYLTITLKTLIIISILLAIIIYCILNSIFINRYWLKGLCFFVPTIILIIIFACYSRNFFKIKATIFLVILTIMLSLIFSSFEFVKISIEDLTTEITDTGKYSKILKKERKKCMLMQFPDNIPTNVEEVKMFYRPQFLQAGMKLELKIKIRQEEINNYIKKYMNDCKQIIHVSDSNLQQLNNIGIFAVGEETLEKPGNFDIYIIENKPYKPNEWNHGYVNFIAVNYEEREILFQSEKW